ncbi:hypothetical protein GCM10011494_02790 [Novosphingobium endophyticum]|uniref:Uncharacterized protein n=1 Tax=Novosphingobium endophyticum TaxID=1955250 RepID=A0A916X4E2_9SPHN|nr:hypothetical protein [Novosphingobium endophyticum]GGB87888.1 hypothetical protein GCM10011494_02790 [Novosphingobium endophyticum]
MEAHAKPTAAFARLQQLHAAFDADPDGFLEATIEPTDDDYRMIGKLIQTYCFADFCARRTIDAIREAAFDATKRNGSMLQDAQVFPKLREAAGLLWAGEVKDQLERASDIMEMHRVQRHAFAHWAVRRFPDEDAMIILSKNAREGERRHGHNADAYESSYGFFAPSQLIEEMRKIDKHVHALSAHAHYLETNVDELRREFDSRGMHQGRPTAAKRGK